MVQPVASAGKLGVIYFDDSAPIAGRYYLGPGESGNLPDISKTTGEKNQLVARGVGHKDQWREWVAVVWDKQGREDMEAIELLKPDKDKHKAPWLYCTIDGDVVLTTERRRRYRRHTSSWLGGIGMSKHGNVPLTW